MSNGSRLALALVATLVSLPASAGVQDFKLKNSTGFVITELNVSSATTTNWGPDILGTDVLADGEATDINIEESEECVWDVQVTQLKSDGTTKQWHVKGIDLCSVSELTFSSTDGNLTHTKK